MKNTGFIIIIFFIIGIIFGYILRFEENKLWYFVFLILLTFAIMLIIFIKYKNNHILILPVFVIFGFIRILTALQPESYELERIALKEKDIELLAVIYKAEEGYNNGYTFFVTSEKVTADNESILASTGIKIYFNGDNIFSEGDRIKIKGKIRKLSAARNPSGFCEQDYYKVRNVEYKIYSENIEKTGEDINTNIILRRFNKKLSAVYDDIFPKDEAGLIKAMITGDKTDLSSYIKDTFSKTGIYHIIAISGLHIHTLAFIVLFISEKIHKRYGKLAAMFFTLIYCVFTGLSVSAVRALIMFLIYTYGKFIYRKSNILNSLFISGFLILFFQPLYLFDVGFQYSFGAVLSLVIFSEPISKIFSKKFKPNTAELFSSSLSVNFISNVVAWLNFFNFSPMSVFANIIILPLSGILIFFGFIAGIIGLFSKEIAYMFSGIVYVILKLFEFVAEAFSELPFSYAFLGKPDALSILIYLLVIFIFMLYLYKRISRKFFIVFIILAVLSNIFFKSGLNRFKIAMLDVGQGDCFVFNYNGGCFIIDGGGYEQKIEDGTGVNILYPYLKYMGVNYADAVFITHSDADHINGIIEIMDYIKIGKIYVSDKDDTSELYKIMKTKADKLKIGISEISEEKRFVFKDDISIECIYPFMGSTVKGNDSSLVLKIKFKDTSFLFTGDISSECEEKIIYEGKDIKADVLKLAHHGSKYSNCEEFIDKVSPKLAIVSAGNPNIYGHPAEETVKRLNERNIKLLNTRENGAVEIYSDGGDIYYKTVK